MRGNKLAALVAILLTVATVTSVSAHDFDPLSSFKQFGTKLVYGNEFTITRTTSNQWKVLDQQVGNGHDLPKRKITYDTLEEAMHDVDAALGGSEPVPTATPVATITPTVVFTPVATNQPTATPDPHHGLCGSTWHAPTDHEHGAQPPAWAENAHNVDPDIPMVCFDHNHASSPAENVVKHPFMKGYLLRDETKPCITAYAVAHGSSMGQERNAQFHSIQVWVKDCAGNVSYWSNLNDFGVPKMYPQGDRVPAAQFDEVHAEQPGRGIIRLETGPGQFCEQWYSAVYENWSIPDVSLTFCQGVEHFDPAEFNYAAGQFNPANFTGGLGLDRQLEVVFPLDRMEAGRWMVDQHARDFECVPGKTATYAGQTYTEACAMRVIQPSLIADINSKAPDFGVKRLNLRTVDRFNVGGPNVVAPN